MKNLNNIILLTISTFIAGIVNYIYHPLMIKFLDDNNFAEFESLISIFNILGVLVGGIGFFLLKEISKNSNNPIKIKSIFIYSNKFLLTIGIVFYLIFAIFSHIIKDFLKIHSILPLLFVGLIIIISFLSTTTNSIMQGLEKFKAIAFFGILGSITKLCLGIFFVSIGFKLFGAIAGFILSSFLIFMLSFIYVYKIIYNTKIDKNIIKQIKKDLKNNYKDIIHSFLLIFMLSMYMNIDIILAKNLFENNLVAIYAGLSVLAKFIIFLGSTIETVYYPQIIKSQNTSFNFVKNAISMMLILGFGSLCFFYLFGDFLLEIIKIGYGSYNKLFLLLILCCIFYMIISFLSKILIGLKKYIANYILFIILAILFLVFKIIKINNLYQFIYLFLVALFILIIVFFIMIFRLKYNKKSSL